MKLIIQGTVFLATLTLASPLLAGKCTSHGGPYLTLRACLDAENEIKEKCRKKADDSSEERKRDLVEDKELVSKSGQLGRIEQDHERELGICDARWASGILECRNNCPP